MKKFKSLFKFMFHKKMDDYDKWMSEYGDWYLKELDDEEKL